MTNLESMTPDTNLKDQATLSQWLDERAEGRLSDKRVEALERHLAANPGLQQQAQEDVKLNSLLRFSPVEVREGFTEEVMVAVRQAGSARRSWWIAAALLLALVGGAALLASLSGSSSTVLSPLATVGDFLITSAVAAAGLLGASWEGAGSVVSAWIQASVLNAVIFGGLVLALNVLFFSLVRRRRARAKAE